jgi:hypothetical protein
LDVNQGRAAWLGSMVWKNQGLGVRVHDGLNMSWLDSARGYYGSQLYVR